MRRLVNSLTDNPHRWALAALTGALGFVLLADVRPAVQAWARVPFQIADLQTAMELAPAQIVGQMLPVAQSEIRATRADILAEVDRQAIGLRGELLPRVDMAIGLIDRRSGEAVAIADGRAKDAISQVVGLRADLKPALTNVAALVKDAKDSLDDLYPEVRGLAASSNVAVTSMAYASEAVRDAAPKVAESVVGIGRSGNGIAADIHTATSDFVRPKTGWQKFKGWLETSGKIAARFL